MFSTRTPILIVGAGISGLTLAQALCKERIPFQIVEQDSSSSSRSAGWGLTIHWALPTFLDLLPQEVQERLPDTYVNQEAVNKGEIGNFAFYDLGSGEARWKVPPNKRIRVSRERLRQLLMTGVDVKVDMYFTMSLSAGRQTSTPTFRSVEFTNRPKCEHTLEQSYSGMYSIFQQFSSQ